MPTEPALRVSGASVVFDGFKALDIERFEVHEREMRVVIGPNGAGKTTLCDVISGKTRLTAGEVFLSGENITGLRDHEIAKRGVGRKFQTPSLFGSLTVAENLELATRVADTRVSEIVDDMELRTLLGIEAQYLSHGRRQSLELAMLLVADARLMLLDEPAAGLSDEETAAMAGLLKRLAAERTVVVIEHDMDFVRQLDVTVTVLNEGRVLVEGPMHVVQADPRVVEAYLGR